MSSTDSRPRAGIDDVEPISTYVDYDPYLPAEHYVLIDEGGSHYSSVATATTDQIITKIGGLAVNYPIGRQEKADGPKRCRRSLFTLMPLRGIGL